MINKRGRYTGKNHREVTNESQCFTCGTGVTMFIATTLPVFPQQGPPPSERANQIEALVRKRLHSLVAKESQLSQIAERKTASGSMVTRICCLRHQRECVVQSRFSKSGRN